MSGSSEGAEPSDEALLAQVRRYAHLSAKAKLGLGAQNYCAAAEPTRPLDIPGESPGCRPGRGKRGGTAACAAGALSTVI